MAAYPVPSHALPGSRKRLVEGACGLPRPPCPDRRPRPNHGVTDLSLLDHEGGPWRVAACSRRAFPGFTGWGGGQYAPGAGDSRVPRRDERMAAGSCRSPERTGHSRAQHLAAPPSAFDAPGRPALVSVSMVPRSGDEDPYVCVHGVQALVPGAVVVSVVAVVGVAVVFVAQFEASSAAADHVLSADYVHEPC